MKIYTKTGDSGTTLLLGGLRVSKANLRIESYGTVDELNAYIGLLRDQSIAEEHRVFLKNIQDMLFNIGSSLAIEPTKLNKIARHVLSEADILVLEKAIDTMEATLPPLRNFILPGGHTTVSFCHIARCVCRRCERLVVALAEVELIDSNIVPYLNRLSDYLFVLGRRLAVDLHAEEVIWNARI